MAIKRAYGPNQMAGVPVTTTGNYNPPNDGTEALAQVVVTRSAGGTLTVKGYQQITSLSTAQTLTVPTGSTMAVIACETQNVRWRDDGTSPTASVGMELLIGQALIYDGDLSAIKFIEEAASAKLNVSYYA